jgi:hypothetical protein
MQVEFKILKGKYGSLADASDYRHELVYSIANPEEEELTPEDIKEAKAILVELNTYLALGEER